MRGVSNHECTHLGLFLSLHLFISSSSSSLGISSHRPGRGVDGAPTGALVFVLSRVRGATTMPRCDRDPSRRSTVAIFGRGPTLPAPGSGTPEPPATCPRQAVKARQTGSGPPAVRFAPPPRDATPRSAFSGRGIIRERQRKHITRRDALEQRRRRARD